MRKRVLILAYMFPPILDAGGFRPLSFAKYLPEFGWEPMVLTRPDTAGLPCDPGQLDSLTSAVRIERVAQGFEESWQDHWRKRFRWFRPVERLLGKPRHWIADASAWRMARLRPEATWDVAWTGPAVEAGLTLTRRFAPHVILATAPPFETLKAAVRLHERTGVPFVADYRDPWTYGQSWAPRTRRVAVENLRWDRRAVEQSARVIAVTRTMCKRLADTYPASAWKIELIPNGYESFERNVQIPTGDQMIMSHVGSISARRWPGVVLDALEIIRRRRPDAYSQIRLRFVGANQGGRSLAGEVERRGLHDSVEAVGPVNARASRDYMQSSDVLVLFEPTEPHCIPGKLFEYLAAKRPILGLVDGNGDAAQLIREGNAGTSVGVKDPDAIASAILEYWERWRTKTLGSPPDSEWLAQFHRRALCRRLANVLDGVTQ